MSSIFGDHAFLSGFFRGPVSSRRDKGNIGIGDFAPDCPLTDTDGRETTLTSYWTKRPVALVFLRHFGCIFCREQVALLRRDYPKFLAANADVVCVAMGAYKTGKAFQIFLDLPFPLVVSGDDNTIFREYGLERGTFKQLFGVNAILRGIQNILRGHAQGLIASDGFQMPGAFVVDREGVIQYAHRSRDAADHVANADLLAALRRLQTNSVSSDQSQPGEGTIS